MDPGKAAVLSALIAGLVGVVGAVAAFAAGKASAKGVIEGVKLQLSDQRDFALWTDKRNAYASFLAAAEEVRIALGPPIRLVGAYLEEGVGSGQAATEARNELHQCYKEFVYRQSALRLSVDDPEVERAWALVSLVGTVLDRFDTWSNTLHDHRDSDDAWGQFNDSRGRFEADLAAWATAARAQLSEHHSS
ncbi:hypothetical protein ACIRP3_43990 [Streptomyces sp. NPDC101209]|uniref:hypothetical protein n=1 Tax=Streptomyces sp. NPDC101209 TaxID=3366129 RepID=UPI00381E4503